MTRKTGIFAGLRRRRWALGLAFGYALLLNALLGTSVEGAMAAAGSDPLAAFAAAPLCSPGDPAPAGSRHQPADHQQTCPLCGQACPMGGCAPIEGGAGSLAFSPPKEITLASAFRPSRAAIGGQSRYASDTHSQGPPAV
jgi:hypothetical protein